ncbi:MAG: TonB-dependent receptor [Balneolaceae bacterium]
MLTIITAFAIAQADTIPPAGSAPSDTLRNNQNNEAEVDTVYFWEFRPPLDSFTADTDSTLRWSQVLNYADVIHRQRGAITSRLGTTGRIDGMNIYTFENRHLDLELEGMDITDPLTGSVNWNRLPTHKIKTLDVSNWGMNHQSRVKLRDHYLTKPRTYLNFDESKFDFSNLEFGYTQNLTRNFNVELSFWDRQDDNGFRRSKIDGQQIVARTYFQYSDHWLLKAGFINNSIDQEQSFGFNIPDLRFFSFNRFNAAPVESSAKGKQASSDIYLQLHNRKNVEGDVTTSFGLHHQSTERNLRYSVDTVATDFRRIEAFFRHNVNLQGFETELSSRLYSLSDNEDDNASLTKTNWLGADLSAKTRNKLANFGTLHATAGFNLRNDSQSGFNVSGRLDLYPIRGVNTSFFAGISSDIPDIQALYWQSEEYSGNRDLRNEESFQFGTESTVRWGENFTVGARAQVRRVTDGIFVNPDSVFTNINSYTNLTGSAWIELDSKMFEGEISVSGQTFSTSAGDNPVNQILDNSGERVWIKGSLFWKNDIFDNAAFLKAGFHAMYSPNSYISANYITPLDRWQNGIASQPLPSFYRVDLDISARIRWFMVLLRWENLFDEVGQLGYFETAGFPMPPRRFMFALRVIFTD